MGMIGIKKLGGCGDVGAGQKSISNNSQERNRVVFDLFFTPNIPHILLPLIFEVLQRIQKLQEIQILKQPRYEGLFSGSRSCST